MARPKSIEPIYDPMYITFKNILNLRKILEPNISLREISIRCTELNPLYSRITYEKVLQGKRKGNKDIWETIYLSLNLTPLEKILVNPSWLIRRISHDYKEYGSNEPVTVYIAEYAGLNAVYYYELIHHKNKNNLIEVERSYSFPCRLIDVYVLLMNQNKNSYIFQDGELPEELIEYQSKLETI